MALSPRRIVSVLKFLKQYIPESQNVRRGNVLAAVQEFANGCEIQFKTLKKLLKAANKENEVLRQRVADLEGLYGAKVTEESDGREAPEVQEAPEVSAPAVGGDDSEGLDSDDEPAPANDSTEDYLDEN